MHINAIKYWDYWMQKFSPINNAPHGFLAEWTQNWFHLVCSFAMLSRFARYGIFHEYFHWNRFLFSSVLAGMGNVLDLWSFARRLATAQVLVRIEKGRNILRLYYPRWLISRPLPLLFKKATPVKVCRCISMLISVHAVNCNIAG